MKLSANRSVRALITFWTLDCQCNLPIQKASVPKILAELGSLRARLISAPMKMRRSRSTESGTILFSWSCNPKDLEKCSGRSVDEVSDTRSSCPFVTPEGQRICFVTRAVVFEPRSLDGLQPSITFSRARKSRPSTIELEPCRPVL